MKWNIVPTGRDGMMDKKIKGKTKFAAYAYRAYSPGFAAPLGPATIPGPLIEAEVGDAVVVNFQNAVDAPVTIHPHGIFYSQDMDGAYKGRHTDPGGFVQPKQTFQYVWEAREGTEGAWLYHDHGPMDPLPLFKGLFGPLIIRPAGAPPPTREFNLTFHSFPPRRDRPADATSAASTAPRSPATRRRSRRTSATASSSTSSRSTTTSTRSTSTATAGPTRRAR